jgi:hypothetical protein
MSGEWVPHEVDLESDQIREVYASFGLAFYFAQILEQTVAMLLATLFGPGEDWLKEHGIGDLLDQNFRTTFGRLAKQLEGRVSPDLIKAIGKTVEDRNKLAHHYFWDHAVEFTKTDGRTAMIAELDEMKDRFIHLNDELEALQAQWRAEVGMSDEEVQRQFNKLMRGEN